ncbi:hypothetical protein PMI35_01278 [Pseudomonas sp. GM78]|uniref:hypothetical protein n=1 Tax=Pseudomonas sp. GM78 TaxID=1144337 RepID=UPI00026F85FD|nr:hypothetical protein [Pseudomonas sp. GM78]EJN31789.1 hypothetical protein PMI35_01278 [Pseudomonas sp. GM78]
MTAQYLNIIGLTLNIIGVAMVFFFGFPQPSHQDSIGIALESENPMPDGRTVGDHEEDARKRKKRYQIASQLALTLMVIGFVFQLIATALPELGHI